MQQESSKALFIKLIHDLDKADGKADNRIITSAQMQTQLRDIEIDLGLMLTQNILDINRENQLYTGTLPSKKSSQEMLAHQRRQKELQENQSILMEQTTLVSCLEHYLFKENQPDGAGYHIDCTDKSLIEKVETGNIAEALRQCIPQEGVPPVPQKKQAPRKR